jgi:membrane-bound ClpP family serine protease
MTEIANEPAVILLAVTLASALIVAEFALPTLGVAGGAGALLIVLAVVGIADAELEWWPLSLVAISIVLWCVMIARRKTSVVEQGIAVALYTGGAIAFGVMADDLTTIVLACVFAGGLAVGFPVLFEKAVRLYDAPSSVGMESHMGRTAVVSSWAATTGNVVLDGSFWNADGPAGLVKDDEVVVTGFEGMTFTVRRPTPDPEGMPMTVPTREER